MGLRKKKSDDDKTSISKSALKNRSLKKGNKITRSATTGKLLSSTKVRVRKIRIRQNAEENPFAVFTEWNSKADEDAYGSL